MIIKSFKLFLENREVSYEESGLDNPQLADLDKNKKISDYEKSRGEAVEKSMDGNCDCCDDCTNGEDCKCGCEDCKCGC